MNIQRKRVAILFGGQSSEHQVSLQSSVNIIKVIDQRKYDLILIGINKIGQWILYNQDNYLIDIEDPINIHLAPSTNYLSIIPGQKNKFINMTNWKLLPSIDIIFSVLHGSYGENGSIQGLLDMLNIPYIGSGVLSSAICMDKDITKRILRDAGILVTPFITLSRSQNNIPSYDCVVQKLGTPLFIKPATQGSSIGITKISNQKSFNNALAIAFNYDDKIIIETEINGREIEIGIIGDNTKVEVSMCGEIITNNDFYNYNAKYIKNNTTQLKIPANLDTNIINMIRNIAKKVFIILGCNIMARIDCFITKGNKILINEINTLPGFTSISMYPKLWESSGINYSNLVSKLIELTLKSVVKK